MDEDRSGVLTKEDLLLAGNRGKKGEGVAELAIFAAKSPEKKEIQITVDTGSALNGNANGSTATSSPNNAVSGARRPSDGRSVSKDVDVTIPGSDTSPEVASREPQRISVTKHPEVACPEDGVGEPQPVVQKRESVTDGIVLEADEN